EERLKVHDLGGAVAEAEKLSGPAAEAAGGWIAEAKARLETDRLVRERGARLAGELAGMKGGRRCCARFTPSSSLPFSAASRSVLPTIPAHSYDVGDGVYY